MDLTLAIQELKRSLAWDLNKKLQHRYQELFMRLGLEDLEAKAHATHPGNEIVALILGLVGKDDEGLQQFYSLLQKLDERASLRLIDVSPASVLFHPGVVRNAQQGQTSNQNTVTTALQPKISNQSGAQQHVDQQVVPQSDQQVIQDAEEKRIPSSVYKFLMVPRYDETLSKTIDDVLTNWGFHQVHTCDPTHEIWVNKKNFDFNNYRYVFKFSVGDSNSNMDICDALLLASEVLFLMTKKVKKAGWIDIRSKAELKARYKSPENVCMVLLFRTLREGLLDSVHHAFYGIPKKKLNELTQDDEFLEWLTSTKYQTKEPFYCCLKFENDDRDLREVTDAVRSTFKKRQIEHEVAGVFKSSINVVIRGTTLLPIMLHLHKVDIFAAFEQQDLKLLSITETCVEEIEDALNDSRNEELREELEALIKRMKQDKVLLFSVDDRHLRLVIRCADLKRLPIDVSDSTDDSDGEYSSAASSGDELNFSRLREIETKREVIKPEEYLKLFKEGKKPDYQFSGVYGRVICGTKPEHFERMAAEDYKRISPLLGPDTLLDLIGLDGIDVMLHIGNEAEWLLNKLNDGNEFKLVVFPQLEDIVLATWENLLQIVELQFPKIRSEILNEQIEELKEMPFDKIHVASDEFKRLGGSAFTALNNSPGTFAEIIAFLYYEIECSRLYTGNGQGEHHLGHEISPEYSARMLPGIPSVQFIDLKFNVDQLKQLVQKENEDRL